MNVTDMRDMAETVFPAHIHADGAMQTVQEHCMETAALAAGCLKRVGLENIGYLAGLLHDMGKFTDAYRRYIIDAARGVPVRRGSVVHTFAGVKAILDKYHTGKLSYSDITAELIAYAIGAHHGLFDITDSNGLSGYEYRISQEKKTYEEASSNFYKFCMDERAVAGLFDKAVDEIKSLWVKIMGLCSRNSNAQLYFYSGLLARAILSAVIEGDRSNTASFMSDDKYNILKSNVSDIWAEASENVEWYLCQLPQDSLIAAARHDISEKCIKFSDCSDGIYRLNVPTGGGKTLSALRFAVNHAKLHSKNRIIYVAPLISIIEQNADAIRKAVAREEWVLEHHSNVVDSKESGELEKNELLAEDWSAPIIVTTLVQLLNTLFSAKTAIVRRFQALCESVIVIDEVQSVPNNMLTLFNLAMNFLSGICHATILLCSATQPCLEEVRNAIRIESKTAVPYDEALWSIFSRTRIFNSGSMRMEEISAFIAEKARSVDSLLVVCNKKSEAEELFFGLDRTKYRCFHLSAAMCPAHRREVLQDMMESLAESKQGRGKTICISTQVIEAGIDISFECAVRFSAGMDSVIQTAGRCNRHGEYGGKVPVYVINCINENLSGLHDIQRGKTASEQLFYEYDHDEKRFRGDLTSDESIRYYYRTLYASMTEDYHDYPVTEPRTTLFDLLSGNRVYANDTYPSFLKQAFRTAGHKFTVFENDTSDVLVPYGKGAEIIDKLAQMHMEYDIAEIKGLIARAKQYSVSLYAYQIKSLQERGGLTALCDNGVYALADMFYDEEIGVSINEKMLFWEV